MSSTSSLLITKTLLGRIWWWNSQRGISGLRAQKAPSQDKYLSQTYLPKRYLLHLKRDGVNGVIVSSMPFVKDGNIIENFKMTLKDGKIVDVQADKGVEVLRNAIAVDEGASYLGEVALVPYDSPISNTKILFYNTLFDENASCHFAFGQAYPSSIKGGENDV
jgi:hypothetical protein